MDNHIPEKKGVLEISIPTRRHKGSQRRREEDYSVKAISLSRYDMHSTSPKGGKAGWSTP